MGINGLVYHNLTHQQGLILDLMVQKEYTADQVARALDLKVRTVYFHMEQIRRAYETQSMLVVLIRYTKELIADGRIDVIMEGSKLKT